MSDLTDALTVSPRLARAAEKARESLSAPNAFSRLKCGDVFWVNFFELTNRFGRDLMWEAALCKDEKAAREGASEPGYLFTTRHGIDGETKYLDLSPEE